MHLHLAALVGFIDIGFQLFSLRFDLGFFKLIAVNGQLEFLLRLTAGQDHRELCQVLFVALGLVVIPLIRRRRFDNRSFVFVQQRRIL